MIQHGLKKIATAEGRNPKDLGGLIRITLEIFKADNTEPPNSATFCMAMDLMKRKGDLFMVNNCKQTYQTVPETMIWKGD